MQRAEARPPTLRPAGTAQPGAPKTDEAVGRAGQPPAVGKKAAAEEGSMQEAAGGVAAGLVGGAVAGPEAKESATPGPAPAAPGEKVAFEAQQTASGEPAPPPAQASKFRILPLPRPPEEGRDHLVIRAADAWAAFLSGAPVPGPTVEFDKEMVVVLRDDLATQPPSRLKVVAVVVTAEALEIACRVERPAPEPVPAEPGAAPKSGGAPESAAAPSAPAPSGQALVVPATDLPVRIVMK